MQILHMSKLLFLAHCVTLRSVQASQALNKHMSTVISDFGGARNIQTSLVRGHRPAKTHASVQGGFLPLPHDIAHWVSHNVEAEEDVRKFWNALQSASSTSLMDKFDIKEFLGKGDHGVVVRAQERHTDSHVVLKFVPIEMGEMKDVLSELYVSKYLRERHVSGVVLPEEQTYVINRREVPKAIQHQFEIRSPLTQRWLCLVEPFMPGGTLLQEHLSPETMLKSLRDVATTMAAMHEHNVFHNDFKADNILLDMQNGKVISAKISDFGSGSIGRFPREEHDDVLRFGWALGKILLRIALRDEGLVHDEDFWASLHGQDLAQLTDEELLSESDVLDKAVGRQPELNHFLKIFKQIGALKDEQFSTSSEDPMRGIAQLMTDACAKFSMDQ